MVRSSRGWVKISAGSLLHNWPIVHEKDPVRHLAGKAHLVGDYQHGHALLGQLLHHVQHLAHHLRVQGGGGLVKEHELGLHGQGPDNGDALLLAAGELVGIAVGLILQTHPAQQLHGLLVALGLFYPACTGPGPG